MGIIHTAGDAVLSGPQHRVIVVRGHVVKAGAAVETVASFISGTVNVHMAVVAPIAVAAITTVLAVVFFVTVGVVAVLAAVIAAVADPVISDKFMAKIAL